MSRIFVSNLPDKISENELRNRFSKKGTITECSLRFTPEGKFRKFAFIGYKEELEATEAVQFFDGSYINTTKIKVTISNDLRKDLHKKAPQNVKPKSQTTSGKASEYTKPDEGAWAIKVTGLPPNAKRQDVDDFFKPIKCDVEWPHNNKAAAKVVVRFENEKDREDAMRRNKNFIGQKKIFLHKFNAHQKIVVPVEPRESSNSNGAKDEDKEKEKALIVETGRLFVRNLPYCCTSEDIEKLFSTYGQLDVQLQVDKFMNEHKGFALVNYVLPENALIAYEELDGSIFQGRMLHIVGGQPRKQETTNLENLSFGKKKDILKKQDASKVKNWNTLFIGQDAVADIIARKYKMSKRDVLLGNSTAFVFTLEQTEIVNNVRNFLLNNGVALNKYSQPSAPRCKNVLLAKNLPTGTTVHDLNDVFKDFIDSVESTLVDRHGIVALIKFKNIEIANQAFKNLVYTRFKHLPLYLEWPPMDDGKNQDEKDIKIGEKASSGESNKREGGVRKVDDDGSDKDDEEEENDDDDDDDDDEEEEGNDDDDDDNDKVDENDKVDDKEEIDKGGDDEDVESEDEDEDEDFDLSLPRRFVFVKNLPEDASEDKIRKFFIECGTVISISFTKYKMNGLDDKVKSGFIEYGLPEFAEDCIRKLQGRELDGQKLEIKISDRRGKAVVKSKETEENIERKKSKTNNKNVTKTLIIKNIPFGATEKDLKKILENYHGLVSIRLPKKLGSGSGSHRGFAFVDFLTKTFANKAFNQLCHNTTLIGRPLVLEFAKSSSASTTKSEEISALRKRTAEKYNPDQGPNSKKRKMDLLNDLETGNA